MAARGQIAAAGAPGRPGQRRPVEAAAGARSDCRSGAGAYFIDTMLCSLSGERERFGSRRLWRSSCALVLGLVAACGGAPTAASRDVEGEAGCYARLNERGVGFERVPAAAAAGVEWPIRLSGSVDGVRVYGGKKDAPTNYLDCRLALALVEWAPHLKREGVVGLQHYSMYRKDATIATSKKASGHALGRAIDVGYFDLRDGRRLSVLKDWKNRARGAEPCEVRSRGDAEETMRELVCDAIERELFQMVLTPHDDDAHRNHLHLEVRVPGGEG